MVLPIRMAVVSTDAAEAADAKAAESLLSNSTGAPGTTRSPSEISRNTGCSSSPKRQPGERRALPGRRAPPAQWPASTGSPAPRLRRPRNRQSRRAASSRNTDTRPRPTRVQRSTAAKADAAVDGIANAGRQVAQVGSRPTPQSNARKANRQAAGIQHRASRPARQGPGRRVHAGQLHPRLYHPRHHRRIRKSRRIRRDERRPKENVALKVSKTTPRRSRRPTVPRA